MGLLDNGKCVIEWLAKDVRKIVFRNIVMSHSEMKAQAASVQLSPDLSLEIYAVTAAQEKRTVYRGKTIKNCCNPSWAIAGVHRSVESESAVCEEMLLQISEDEDCLSKVSECRKLHFSFYLEELVSLGSISLVNITSFPVNSVLFYTDTGYYVKKSLYEQLVKSGLVIPTSRIVIDDELETAAIEVISMTEKMKSSMLVIEKLRHEATVLLSSAEEKHKKRAHMNDRREALKQLREQVKKAEEEASDALAAEATERTFLGDTKNLIKSVESCAEFDRAIYLHNCDNTEQEAELVKLLFLLESRQCKVIEGLRSIYPIVLLESGNYSIRGAELPLDPYSTNSQRDEEHTSTALGYAVHILILVSKYLDITLRYQLIFCSSRSSVGDSAAYSYGALPGTVILPLYKKNVEKDRFERAVIWLGRDVQQILSYMGIEYEPKKNVLYNLNKIFLCYAQSSGAAF